MSAFNSIEIGKRALMAQQYALDATSNNVANVNTPGYSRRTVIMKETDPLNKNGHLNGTGVLVNKLQNYRQEFYDKEIRNTNSSLSASQNDTKYLSRIETILAEPSELGINEIIDEYFNTFKELANNPQHTGLRNNIISQTKHIAERFNSTAEKLLEARNDSLRDIRNNITEINSLIGEISGLNKEIVNANTQMNGEAQTMLDQRALKLEELSKYAETKVSYDGDGAANVFINGLNLITKDKYNTLEAYRTTNAASNEQTVNIRLKDTSKNLDITNGELGSLLNQYNVILDGNDTTGDLSVSTELNKFASTFAEKINNIAQQGYGKDDSGNTPPGYTFFDSKGGDIDAFSIKLSEDIDGKPENIPLSDEPQSPGNSNNALKFVDLADDPTSIDNTTFSEYYSSFLGKIASESKNAQNSESTTTLIFDQLNSQRQSVMGVNLDEEAVNLVKYQKAFEASSRAITLANDILSTLVNIIR